MESILQKRNERIENIVKGFEGGDILLKAHKLKIKSACGIVIKGSKILLGLSNADDDRKDKWCFPGGGVDDGEDCISAAIRETSEEMGLYAKAFLPSFFVHQTKPFLAFAVLTCDSDDVTINDEFEKAEWFDIDNLPEDIHPLNKDLLMMVNVTEIGAKR